MVKPRHAKYRHKHGDTDQLQRKLAYLEEHLPDVKACLDAHGPVTFVGQGAARMVFRLRGGKTVAKVDCSWDKSAKFNRREFKAYKQRLLPMAACRLILDGRILLMRAVRFPGQVRGSTFEPVYEYDSVFDNRYYRELYHPPLVKPHVRKAEWADKIQDWAQGGYTRTTKKLVCYDVSHEYWIPLE